MKELISNFDEKSKTEKKEKKKKKSKLRRSSQKKETSDSGTDSDMDSLFNDAIHEARRQQHILNEKRKDLAELQKDTEDEILEELSQRDVVIENSTRHEEVPNESPPSGRTLDQSDVNGPTNQNGDTAENGNEPNEEEEEAFLPPSNQDVQTRIQDDSEVILY